MEVIIRAKAPLRVSFAGGGTDVPPFPEREGGLVLNATINRYTYGSLQPRDDGQIGIHSVDFGLAVTYGLDEPVILDGKLDLAKAAIRRLVPDETSGFDLFLHSNAPPGTGLGSSSSLMVTLVGLLARYAGRTQTEYDVAHTAYVLEREELGIRGGLQDQYAAAFGGFNFIELDGERVIVNPLRIAGDTINELEHNMLLCYLGTTRASHEIIEDQTARLEREEDGTLGGLRRQKELATAMKNALLQGRLTEFGRLLGDAWECKKQMSPKITNPHIDAIYEEACALGALGGKVTGAGGGGHMLLYCDFQRKHDVAEALIRLGATVSEFSFEPRGLTTWEVRDG